MPWKLWQLIQRENTVAKSQNMSDNPIFNRVFEKTIEVSSALAQAASKSADTMPEAICLALAATSGAMGVVASLVQHEDDNADPSADHVLFACLLVANTTSPVKGTKDAIFAFDPSVVLDTMVAFEKLTGRKPDALLLSNMVGAARDMARDGDAPLKAFMAARPSSTMQ